MDEKYRTAVDAAAIFSETDPAGNITYVNDQFCNISGYSENELLGANHRILNSGHHSRSFFTTMWQTISSGKVWSGEICNKTKSGSLYWVESTMVPLINNNGKILKYVSIRFDVTPKQQLMQELQWRVGHDALTNLPNRVLLSELLNESIRIAEKHQQPLVVAMLDLDEFKSINDRYGHAAGDRFLIEIASRLKLNIEPEDIVARIAGDEFVLLIKSARDEFGIKNTIRRILRAISMPHTFESSVERFSASIGVTLYPNDNGDAGTLLRHADQAMYQAKQAGKNRFYVFDVTRDKEQQDTHRIVALIENALERGELCLHYQPKVNFRTRSIVGFEALIRWQHPQLGTIMPQLFIPQIEESEIIIKIGEWVIDQALKQVGEWVSSGHDWTISVNIAPRHFQKINFASRLKALLTMHPKVSPHRLDIEILESAAIGNLTQASECLSACHRLGVSFSMDDFGTGYSSLSYLKRLPTQTIKIDQSFIGEILENRDDQALTEAIIALARTFDRQVIAEGVKTIEHGKFLMRLGCDVMQGYGIAKPMPSNEILEWAQSFSSTQCSKL